MREILFRGKKVSNGEWIYGMTISFGTIKRKSNDLFIEISEEKWCGIKKETIGQFTGLTDKNGVKIFEGDIIKTENFKKPYFISFGNSDKWGQCFCVESEWSICQLNKDWSKSSEVIGNIHDNPELLK